MDGTRATIYQMRPCSRCGGRVRLVGGVCDRCKTKHLRPQPGPQEQLLACPADIVLTGGGAGSGKSISLLLDAACYADVPKWNGLILRANKKDVVGAAGIYNKARKLFSGIPGMRYREGNYVDIRWPSGATLEFRHLDGHNVYDYQGLEYAWIGVDEATHFDMAWLRYLITRMRTDSGVRCLMRMTCNPDPDHELRQWVDWYLHPDGTSDRSKNGVIRYWAMDGNTDAIVWGATAEECADLSGRPLSEVKSFSYVSALVEVDNPILLAENPDYVANLAQSGRVNEERLRRGNWNVREEVGGMLRYSRWGHDVKEPFSPIYKWARAWDKASTRPRAGAMDPDFTVGVLMGWDLMGRFYIADVVACRDEPPEVTALQRQTAMADGPEVWQLAKLGASDTGKSDFLHTRNALRVGGGRVIPVREQAAKQIRAQPLADALAVGMGKDVDGNPIPRGWIWNRDNWLQRPYEDAGGNAPRTMGALFWRQVDKFFDGKEHDDIPDAMADAYNELSRPEPEQESPIERFKRLR